MERTIKNTDRKVIVVATSNDISAFKKSRAFLDRWKQYEFTADLVFAMTCMKRLAQVCILEGIAAPDYSAAFDDDNNFSMRRALDLIETCKETVA